MGKTIKFYGNKKNFIIYNKKQYYYEICSGRIQKSLDIEQLLSDENYYKNNVDDLEFNRFEIIYDYNNGRKSWFVPLSKELIEYYLIKNVQQKSIQLTNTNLKNNVDCFYEFSREVEIEGIRTSFTRSFAFEDLIYIETTEDEELNATMTKMFGEPKNIPELESEKYGSGLRYFYFYVPKSRIDKIIGIKRFRDTTTIGEEGGEQFTGEIEEIVLDMHHFDENIYAIFKEHGMLSIEE